MDLCVGQGRFESPDGNYMIDIGVYPIGNIPPYLDVDEILPYVIQNDIAAYTIGRLKRDPVVRSDGAKVWSGEDPKVIYFDKYDGSEIPVIWEDETTVKIDGIALKVPDQVFDYRRNW